MVADLKYFRRLPPIERVPPELKELLATGFEIDGSWMVRGTSRRRKWIDQTHSLNLYVTGSPADAERDLSPGLTNECKTTYYLRSTSATSVGKSTLWVIEARLTGVSLAVVLAKVPPAPACSIENPD
jgi:ribonucleoside-diphosphate reductase alpha chain